MRHKQDEDDCTRKPCIPSHVVLVPKCTGSPHKYINASTSTTFSLVGSGVGFLLLIVSYVRGHRRIDPVFAWLFGIVVTAIVGGAFLSLDIEEFLKTTTRILCGVIWILWLGSQTDWVSLRQILLLFRIPENIVASLDHAPRVQICTYP